MTVYGDELQLALELIAEAGGPIVIAQTRPDVIDPVSQAITPGSERVWHTKGVGLPPGTSRDFPAELLKRDVIEIWVAAKNAPFTPEPGNTIKVGSKTRSILTVYELAPDFTPIVWKFYAEAGTHRGIAP